MMKLRNTPKQVSTVRIPDQILSDVESSDINRYTMYVFATLLSYTDNQFKCFPTLDTLAIDNKCSKVTLNKRLKELEDKGYIKITKVRRKPNVYQLLKIPKGIKNKTVVTRDFIKSETYTIDEKILIIMSLNDMVLGEDNSARIKTNISKLGKMCNMSWRYCDAVIKSLTNKGVITEVEKGFIVNLDILGQAVIYLNDKVKELNKRMNTVEHYIDVLKSEGITAEDLVKLVKAKKCSSNIEDADVIK